MRRRVRLTRPDARRLLLGAHLLGGRAAGVQEVLEHHGYVQIDPINVCGRMHDHILRNRVAGYAEGGLSAHLHGDDPARPKAAGLRTAFEHHLPSTNNLVALPLGAWRHLPASMRERTRHQGRWMGRLTPRERDLAARILDLLGERGPLGPEALGDERKGRSVWGSATLAKATLQKLFFHGRVLIAARQSNRRLYDLPERVIPRSVLDCAESAADDTDRWLALLRLRQHRIARLSKAEQALVGDGAVELEVEGCPLLHGLEEDLALLDTRPTAPVEALLLAPLDPMIYRRDLTRSLWDFDYTWEVYTPEAKRKRGYYALPLLSGGELVGHVDLWADRARGRLEVRSRSVRRGHLSSPAVRALGGFLGLGRC